MRDYKKYIVWKQSHHFTLMIYTITKEFPKDELYGLVSQMRRSAVSIGANIAEGSAKRSEKDFARFLEMALGSAAELEYLISIARDLKYISLSRSIEMSEEIVSIKKQLYQFIKKLEN